MSLILIVATPTVPMAVLHHQAQGGFSSVPATIQPEGNALKLFNKEGRNIDRGQLDILLKRAIIIAMDYAELESRVLSQKITISGSVIIKR